MTSVTKPESVAQTAKALLPKGKTRAGSNQDDSTRSINAPAEASSPVVKKAVAADPGQEAVRKETVSRLSTLATKALDDLTQSLGYEVKKTRLQFAEDPDLKRVIVRVLDRDSGEVLLEIPQEEMLKAAKVMKRLNEPNDAFKGLLVKIVT
ncbi:MAG: flagellar protein FlaG [Candidatus Lernaella stagnicola]|nr:flagellar protein FlaG [Candidatus Lernaella stagnicola]